MTRWRPKLFKAPVSGIRSPLFAVSFLAFVFLAGIAGAVSGFDMWRRAPKTGPVLVSPSVPDGSQDEFSRDIDLGTIQDSQAHHTFTVLNTSDEAFTVRGVVKSCACQDVDVPAGVTVPSRGKLPVHFSLPAGSGGQQKGTLEIKTDSPEKDLQHILLNLSATFPRRVCASPRSLVFSKHDGAGLLPQKLVVISDTPGVLDSLIAVESSRGLVSANQVSASASELVYEVTADTSLGSGEGFDMLTFRFNDPVTKVYGVRVRIRD